MDEKAVRVAVCQESRIQDHTAVPNKFSLVHFNSFFLAFFRVSRHCSRQPNIIATSLCRFLMVGLSYSMKLDLQEQVALYVGGFRGWEKCLGSG